MKEAKFQIQELLGIGMVLVVLGIGIAFGLQVMGEVRDDMCPYGEGSSPGTCLNSTGGTSFVEYSEQYNATRFAIDGVSKIPEKLPTIVTVIVAAVIIGILVTYLYSRFK